MSAWEKSGWRSLKHKGYPKLVVRFGPDGTGKGKLLTNPEEFAQNEIAAGRVPEETVASLVIDAALFWAELTVNPNTERKSK